MNAASPESAETRGTTADSLTHVDKDVGEPLAAAGDGKASQDEPPREDPVKVAESPTASTPREVVDAFLEALANEDVGRVALLLDDHFSGTWPLSNKEWHDGCPVDDEWIFRTGSGTATQRQSAATCLLRDRSFGEELQAARREGARSSFELEPLASAAVGRACRDLELDCGSHVEAYRYRLLDRGSESRGVIVIEGSHIRGFLREYEFHE